eukprot:Trichotokara_eunicae@DN4991_c0_g1_i1.p1
MVENDASFEGFEEKFYVRLMEVEDYAAVSNLLPKVTRCYEKKSSHEIEKMLLMPTFFPFVCIEMSTKRTAGYAELHLRPHLCRAMDSSLEKVVVDNSYRGMGVGTKLCQYVIRMARDEYHCGKIDLTAEKEDAIHIYQNKLGFEKWDTGIYRLQFKDKIPVAIPDILQTIL